MLAVILSGVSYGQSDVNKVVVAQTSGSSMYISIDHSALSLFNDSTIARLNPDGDGEWNTWKDALTNGNSPGMDVDFDGWSAFGMLNLTTTGTGTFGSTISAATGSTIGNLTLANGSITDSSGSLSFGDENLSTTGTLGAGVATLASTSTIGNLTLADGSITDSSGAISFDNENLSTTGTAATGNLTVTGTGSFSSTVSAATGSTVGTLTLANGSITDSSGSLSFGDENVSTTGTLTVAGTANLNGGLKMANGTQGNGYFMVSDANGNASWQSVSASVTVHTEAVTMRGVTNSITKPTTMLRDEITLTDDGSGWCTVDMGYAFLNAAGAAGGTGETRVFQLPAGYQFDLTYHMVSTAANPLTLENGWAYGGLAAALAGSDGYILNNNPHWNEIYVVPMNATEFRIGTAAPAGAAFNWVYIGTNWAMTDPHNLYVSFRFKKN